MTKVIHEFEWDANRARTNLSKHGVSFLNATAIFSDALALTIFDDDHNDDEDRWVTLGQTSNGQYLVVIHTFQHTDSAIVQVRIISARKANKDEIYNYQHMPR